MAIGWIVWALQAHMLNANPQYLKMWLNWIDEGFKEEIKVTWSQGGP